MHCSMQALGAPTLALASGVGAPRGVSLRQGACRTALRRRCQAPRAAPDSEAGGAGATTSEPAPPAEQAAVQHESGADQAAQQEGGEKGELVYREPSGSDRFWTGLKLAFALPWRRFKKGSVLTIELGGSLPEKVQGRFSPATSLPSLCACLRKAALDPRINGVYIKISPLGIGWGKLLEVRRHLEYFKASGKFSIAYIERGGEKEYFLGTAAGQLIVPPTAQLSLRGFSVAGTFLRGVLDKVGVEPQVKRIGQYKSAGDQLLRTDMSDAQREQLSALLEDIYGTFCSTVAEARGKSAQEVRDLLDRGVYDMEELLAGGWVDALQYEDEIEEQLKKDTAGKEDKVSSVALRKYAKVGSRAFVHSGGNKAIAIIRASGAIVGGSGGVSETITQDEVIRQLRSVRDNKKVEAVVLRVDSPGGDALTSDLMWREIQKLAEKKPVIASMSDVAASGGYYMAMACNKIVAEALTITGSIGVVTGKFNLAGVFNRIGYNKETISAGKYAEVLVDNRGFNPEEAELFDKAAEFAYESFRNRAAASRGMANEDMQKYAQGRVWSGSRAIEVGLVDALGGINRALSLAKEAAGIPADERVLVMEVSRGRTSPLALLQGGASASALLGALQLLPGANASSAAYSPAGQLGASVLMGMLQQAAAGGGVATGGAMGVGGVVMDGRPQCLMPDLQVEGAGSSAAAAAAGGIGAVGGGGGLPGALEGALDWGLGGGMWDGEDWEWLEM